MLLEPTKAQPSRADLIAAFNRTLAASGACQSTDLHVRKLLCYVCIKDTNGKGIQRSLQQLADRLLLSIPSLRRVIHRAINHFKLLIVTAQHQSSGKQTINRYSINWPALSDHAPGSSEKSRARSKRTDSRLPPQSKQSSSTLENTDALVGSSCASDLPNSLNSSSLPPVTSDHAPPTNRLSGSDPALCDHAPGSTDVSVGSSSSSTFNSLPSTLSAPRTVALSDHPPLPSALSAPSAVKSSFATLPNSLNSYSLPPVISDHASDTPAHNVSELQSGSDRLS